MQQSILKMDKPTGIFQFKAKSYSNEEGEYTAWKEAEPGNIIQFVMIHWFNETLPNNMDIIVIKNQQGDQLVIDHTALEKVASAGKEAITSFAEGDELRLMLMGLKRFTKIDPYNLKNARRKVADYIIAKGEYSF